MKQRGFVLIPLLVLFLVGVLGYFFYKNFLPKLLPTKNTQEDVTPSATPGYTGDLIIQRKTANGTETIYQGGLTENPLILRWQNYLFFQPTVNVDLDEKLVRYNIDTGKTDVVYSENRDNRYLTNLQMINGTLYFSISGYLAGADTFWLSSPTSTPQKLANSGGSRIDFEHGRYWLKGGEGDACWGIETFALFNPTTKTVTPVATSESGCAGGEEFIGFDSKDRMLMASHQNLEGSKYPDEQIYEYVSAIHIDSPTTKDVVIAKESMPEGITGIKYSSQSGQIAMVGKELYLHDLNSSETKKIADVPNDWMGGKIYNWIGNKLCLAATYVGGTSGPYLVNLDGKTVEKNNDYCKEDLDFPEVSHAGYQDKLKEVLKNLIIQLDLPNDFEVFTEGSRQI